MHKCGIICEYDPFHNGHKYHIEKTKERTNADIVCVMSGDFTQRARPAFFDKSLRANAALASGADAVIELPVVYSTAPAEIFAYGAVKILSQIADLKYISFGVETDDYAILKKIADLQADEPPAMKEMMRVLLNQGFSYPNCLAESSAAFLSKADNTGSISSKKHESDCITKHIKDKKDEKDEKGNDNKDNCFKNYILDILSSPNNVLAIEYLKAIKRLRLELAPVFIKRSDKGYNNTELTPPYASATALRRLIECGAGYSDYSEFVPFDLGKSRLNLNLYNSLSRLFLLQNPIPSAEGLEKKLKKAAEKHTSINEIIEAVKSKRYTYSRILRLIFSTMSDINSDFFKYKGDFFYRVLGVRSSFKSSIKQLGTGAIIRLTDKPLINQTAEDIFKVDKRASEIYSIITDTPADRFYKKLLVF